MKDVCCNSGTYSVVTGDDEQAVRIGFFHLLNKIIDGSVSVPEGSQCFLNDFLLQYIGLDIS